MDGVVVKIPEQLGSILRAARTTRHLTQGQVADRLGISVQGVSKLERNAASASFERIHRLCVLLGLELVLRDRDSPSRRPPAAW